MSRTHVPLGQIEDNPYQPRMDVGDVESLAEAILKHGMRQLPEARLLVGGELAKSFTGHTGRVDDEWCVTDENAVAQLASGHRRVEAVRLLNDDETVMDAEVEEAGLVPGYVPVDLQKLTDAQLLDLLTIENAQREQLSAIEEARLIQTHEEQGRSNGEIASTFSRSASWVSNRKRLLALPQRMQAAVHKGDLSVRQARALMPIFEADTEEVDFPEGNRFHPEQIIDRALDGRSSEDLRRDVTQFESWLRQLKGETQQEVREQEYEKELESDQQDDEQKQRDGQESHSGVPAGAVDDAGARLGERGDDRGQKGPDPNAGGAKKGVDQTEPTDAKRAVDSTVGGDGEPSDPGGVDEEFRAVAEQMADKIDQSVLTSHLIVLGLAREQDLTDRILEWLHAVARGANGAPRSGLQDVREELDELGYDDVDVPEAQAGVGQVVPGQVDALLSADGEDMWDDTVAETATIASLLVAHRVAGARQETWRTREIADVVQQRVGSVTEEDVPESVLADVEAEVERRIQVSDPEEPEVV